MAGVAYSSKAALCHVKGSPGQIRAVPRRMFRTDPLQLAQLHHHAITEAVQLSATNKASFIVDASQLGVHNVNPVLLALLHNHASTHELYQHISKVTIENPNVVSKAFYSLAQALGCPLCSKIELRSVVGANDSDDSSDDESPTRYPR